MVQAMHDLLIQYAGPGALPVRAEEKGEGVYAIRVAWKSNAGEHRPEGDACDGIVSSPSGPNLTKWNHLPRVHEIDAWLRHARFVCFADDDVRPAEGVTWRGIFDLFARSRGDVGQAALTADSYFSHDVTVRQRRVRWRRTNFVEMMAPVMRAEQALDWFPAFLDLDETAWGVELLWSGERRVCVILDETPMVHTRPVRALDHAKRYGRDSERERELFAKRWGLPYPPAPFRTLREVV
jgi:hypothetical protein